MGIRFRTKEVIELESERTYTRTLVSIPRWYLGLHVDASGEKALKIDAGTGTLPIYFDDETGIAVYDVPKFEAWIKTIPTREVGE